MKQTEPQSIRQIVDYVLNQSLTERSVLEHRAAYMWPGIVGPTVNRVTQRCYVRDGVLHAYLSSAVIKQEISFMRSAIRDQINSALNADVITDVKIH